MPKAITISQPSEEERRKRAILIPPNVWDDLDALEKNLKSKFISAFRYISRDIGHPSLRIELIKTGKSGFYRARIDQKYRIHFELQDNKYLILAIGPHRIEGIG